MFTIITELEKSVLSKASVFRRKVVCALIGITLLTCGLLIVSNDLYAQEQKNDSSLIVQEDSSNSDAELDDDKDTSASPSTNIESEPSQNQAWDAFVPPLDKFDWIQLKSGEWLKGELKVLYDKKLEFDSDELDLFKVRHRRCEIYKRLWY